MNSAITQSEVSAGMTSSGRAGVRIGLMLVASLSALALLWWMLGMMASASAAAGRGGLSIGAQGNHSLLISAVHTGLVGLQGQDEAFRLTNVTTASLVLTDSWRAQDAGGNLVLFPTGGITIGPGASVWCARNALSFAVAFGYLPSLEYGSDSSPDVPDMQVSGQFRLADDGGSVTLLRLAKIDAANPGGGAWPAGTGTPGDRRSMERVDPCAAGGDENWKTSVNTTVGIDAVGQPITGTPGYTNSVYVGSPARDCPEVVINEVSWAGTGASPNDEWMELYNNTSATISLSGWSLGAADGVPSIGLTGSVPPRSFYLLERTDDTTVSNQPADQTYTGALENTGETLDLYRAELADVVVYGDANPVRPGWDGPALQGYTNGDLALAGQVLFRKLDEVTGLPTYNIGGEGDWANSTVPGTALYGPVREGDLWGKRVMYPGWDNEAFSHTLVVTATAHVTVGIAPDNAYTVVADLLDSAQQSIVAEGYTFESVWLTHILTERIAAGVQVTVLLEGAPVGGIPDQELWNAQQIQRAGGHVFFAHQDSAAGAYKRYANQHAKFLVVDDLWVAVSSENWGNHAMPVDEKSNGTAGDRGVVLITDQMDAVRYVRSLFESDCDPDHHGDLAAYGTLGRYTVAPTYTAEYSTGGGYEYAAPFSATVGGLVSDALEVVHAPEQALGYRDGLIGLVLRAGQGDEVYVEQLDEPLHWGPSRSDVNTDPNPRLEAYLEAARQGARVRILLDSGFDEDQSNYQTALYALAVARDENLDLEVRLGNPTGRGIHNKMVLVVTGGAQYVHVGSLNGSETSSKANRELALQVRSEQAYEYLRTVFEYDWAHSHGPYQVYLPIVYNDYVRPADDVLISEVLFKLGGHPTEEAELGEWIELYNPTIAAVDVSGWSLGDAVRATDYERMYTFPPGTVIAPQGVLVIARQAAAYQALGYARKLVPDLELQSSNAVPDMIRSSWGTGEFGLGNQGDEVILVDEHHVTVDALAYGTGSYPGVRGYSPVDGVYNGSSLERYPANRDLDDCSHDFRVLYLPDPGRVAAW